MPIPLYSMLSFSIVSHRASLNSFPHRLSTWVWVVLYLFYLLIFLQKSSLETAGLIHSTYSTLRIFITVTISWDLYLVLHPSLVLIIHCPFSFVGPYIFLNIFFSHVINIFFSFTCQRPCLCSGVTTPKLIKKVTKKGVGILAGFIWLKMNDYLSEY